MSLMSRVKTDVEYKGGFYPLWHVSQWDRPSLMVVVAPRGSGASEFIAQTEAFLDHRANTGSVAVPKFVALNAKDVNPTTVFSPDWNAIVRFMERPEFAPGSVAAAARFIVLHVSMVTQADLPDQKQPSQQPGVKSLTQWQVDADSGLWTKNKQPNLLPLTPLGHKVAFLIRDRLTNTTYADVQ